MVSPRDPAGARVYADGRWDTLARFSPVRRHKMPLMFHKPPDSSVAAVWMAEPDTCFAVGTGYASADPKDRFYFNNPSYLSLFGDDIEAGEELSAKSRLAVVDLEHAYDDAIDLYDQFRPLTGRSSAGIPNQSRSRTSPNRGRRGAANIGLRAATTLIELNRRNDAIPLPGRPHMSFFFRVRPAGTSHPEFPASERVS